MAEFVKCDMCQKTAVKDDKCLMRRVTLHTYVYGTKNKHDEIRDLCQKCLMRVAAVFTEVLPILEEDCT